MAVEPPRPGQQPSLRRSLGLGDAIVIGLGSMIGAGVFAVFAPAAAVAGPALLIGLAIAAAVAYCNATSSAQLAAQYPTSGGTYHYGRQRLGEWWGFAAGWGFVVGKTASCAAMALTFAVYVAPEPWQKPVAVLAVAALTAVNLRGITRTARLARVIVTISLASLLVVIVVCLAQDGGGAAVDQFGAAADSGWDGALGALQAGGLIFFAFAGYARIATLGEEVRDPERVIPRAIMIALGVAAVLYLMVAVAALATLGPDRLAASSAPIAEMAEIAGGGSLRVVVVLGAAAGALGALLALVAGVGRTTLAMAREADLPRWLAVVDERHRVPRHAEISIAVVVIVLVMAFDLRHAIGFSSFGVLLYYFVANVSAFTQHGEHRRYPRVLQVIGALACVMLVAALPVWSVAIGVTVLAVGIVGRVVVRRRSDT